MRRASSKPFRSDVVSRVTVSLRRGEPLCPLALDLFAPEVSARVSRK